jgi:putative serine protease PepD
VTSGIVSGALVDRAARLVGINTAGAAVPNSGGGGIGLGFAIPVDFAKRTADELISEGKVTRTNLGLQVQPVPEELARQTGGTAGLFVQTVTPGGAADRAGLQPGDVIVEIEGEPAHSVDPLVVKTLTLKPGDTLDLKYQRHGESHTTALRVTAEDAGCARVNLP